MKYQTEEDGIIILGTEPHFYSTNSFYMSQFCQIKAIPNQSKETAWSFQMDEIATYDKNSKKILFTKNKVDFLIDRGLIIGTDEYKNKMDELIFNDLIKEKICFREINIFTDEEKGTNDEYYIYYCSVSSFMGNKDYPSVDHYKNFPSLEFSLREANMTFILYKQSLFHVINSRAYFLVVFKKSENTENNIWKLGEPFFSHFQFTFDQDSKTVGFYNPKLEKIENDKYMDDENYKNKDKNKSNGKKIKENNIYLIILFAVVVILLAILAGSYYYFGKKNKRK